MVGLSSTGDRAFLAVGIIGVEIQRHETALESYKYGIIYYSWSKDDEVGGRRSKKGKMVRRS